MRLALIIRGDSSSLSRAVPGSRVCGSGVIQAGRPGGEMTWCSAWSARRGRGRRAGSRWCPGALRSSSRWAGVRQGPRRAPLCWLRTVPPYRRLPVPRRRTPLRRYATTVGRLGRHMIVMAAPACQCRVARVPWPLASRHADDGHEDARHGRWRRYGRAQNAQIRRAADSSQRS